MKWLLFLLFTFSTFGAWAGNCDLNTSYIQKGIEGYGIYIFKPVTLSGTLALREGTFPNDDWLFVCQSLENVVITLTGEAQHSTEYNFLVGNEKYKIKFDLSPHNLSGKDFTTNAHYKLSDIFTDTASIDYAISQGEVAGRQVITPGQPFTVSYKLNLRYCQNKDKTCTDIPITYIFHIILQINVMTCGFDNPTTEINMGDYNFIDIKQGTVDYRPEMIYIDCRQGDSGMLQLTPGKIEYTFRSASLLKNGLVLANDEESSATGAGEVGFRIQDANGADIHYDNGYLYESPQAATQGKNPIILNIKPMKYGENIRTGTIKSRVIIVVNNN